VIGSGVASAKVQAVRDCLSLDAPADALVSAKPCASGISAPEKELNLVDNRMKKRSASLEWFEFLFIAAPWIVVWFATIFKWG
jgi:hypothetical protein